MRESILAKKGKYGYGKSRNVKIDLTFITVHDITEGEYVS